jgi:sortase A
MRSAWRWIRIFTGTLVVLAATGAGAVALGPRSDIAAPHAKSATVSTPSTSAPAPVAAPVVVAAPVDPPLPIPEASPGNGWAPVPIVAIGELSIPKIGLQTAVYEGVQQPVLATGPGHWPGTAAPGGFGNTVIAAHRVTHGGPFRYIDQLVPGDSIVVSSGGATFTYVVTGSSVVSPEDTWIVDQHPGHTLTLFSCHPLGSSAQRYVVTAELA